MKRRAGDVAILLVKVIFLSGGETCQPKTVARPPIQSNIASSVLVIASIGRQITVNIAKIRGAAGRPVRSPVTAMKMALLRRRTWFTYPAFCAVPNLFAAGPVMVEPWHVTSRDPHSAVWESVHQITDEVTGTMQNEKHRYVELATGLNYLKPTTAQYEPSEENFVITPQGDAVAAKGQRQLGELDINEKKVLAQKVFGSNLVLDRKKAPGSAVKPWSLLVENSSSFGLVPVAGLEPARRFTVPGF
jgi:hypothetical protein